MVQHLLSTCFLQEYRKCQYRARPFFARDDLYLLKQRSELITFELTNEMGLYKFLKVINVWVAGYSAILLASTRLLIISRSELEEVGHGIPEVREIKLILHIQEYQAT